MSQSRTTVRRGSGEPGRQDRNEEVVARTRGTTDEDIVSQTDELLDEIDALLEDQSVLTGFRQRSGQ